MCYIFIYLNKTHKQTPLTLQQLLPLDVKNCNVSRKAVCCWHDAACAAHDLAAGLQPNADIVM
jgi:hypothetical protein